MSNVRTQARERATLLLFEADNKEQSVGEVVENLEVTPDHYVLEIIDSYTQHQTKIEDLISKFAKGWATSRMPTFDRAVLRMGITELVRSADIPVGTIISEAVLLCEQYSTDDSPKYINGVLGSVAHQVRGVELLEKTKE